MTPLILRPAPQGEALAAQLRQAGYTPIVCPLFTQVAGTDHNCHVNAHFMHLFDPLSDIRCPIGADPEAFFTCQSLTA